MSLESRSALMRIVAVILAIYAIIWGLAPYASINISARFLLDMLDWPVDSMPNTLDTNTMWLSAIGAGLLAAVAVLLWGVVAPALARGDREVAHATLIAFLAWYFIDGAGSISVGIVSNVVFNTLYLMAIAIPLVGIPRSAN